MNRPAPAEAGTGQEPGSSDLQISRLDAVVDALSDRNLEVVTEQRNDGQRYLAQCPTHDDGKPSLVLFDHGTKIGLHCRAGCDKGAVVSALGLSMGDLFSADYVYEDGRVVHRGYGADGAKTFRQENGKGSGVLYRLSEVIAAVAADKPVFLVEGEKDVETLRALGVVATTAAGGATGAIRKVDVTPLTGARVVAIPDADKAGNAWLRAALDRLAVVGARVEIRGVATGKDVTDHVEAGHALADLVPSESTGTVKPRGRELRWQKASEMRPRATRWLYAEDDRVLWLPLGGLSLLGGREGVGKTTIAYGIAAQITRGTLPGSFEGEPRGVIIAATEDAWEQTVIPRLLACDADLDRVYRVDAVTPEGLPVGLQLPADVEELTALIAAEEVALVLLDPLMSTVGAGLDTNKDADVRRALEPMSRLAAEAQVAMLGLIHVNKSQGSDLLTRLMASRAFAAVARTVLFAAKDEDVPVEGVSTQHETFLFGQIKNNLGPKVPHALRYRIEGRKVAHDDELDLAVFGSRIVWGSKVDGSIQEIVTKQEARAPEKETAQDRAEAWLRGVLGYRRAGVEFSQLMGAAEAAGHNRRTLQRARERMGVLVTTIPGTRNQSRWSLPVSTDTTVMTGTTDTTVTTSGGSDSCVSSDSRGRTDRPVTAPIDNPGGTS
jgi:hypothetical protein